MAGGRFWVDSTRIPVHHPRVSGPLKKLRHRCGILKIWPEAFKSNLDYLLFPQVCCSLFEDFCHRQVLSLISFVSTGRGNKKSKEFGIMLWLFGLSLVRKWAR